MFKALILIMSTTNPANYALGISQVEYPTEQACHEAEAKHSEEAKKVFSEERVGPTAIATKCFPSEKDDAIYQAEVEKRAKQIKPGQQDVNG